MYPALCTLSDEGSYVGSQSPSHPQTRRDDYSTTAAGLWTPDRRPSLPLHSKVFDGLPLIIPVDHVQRYLAVKRSPRSKGAGRPYQVVASSQGVHVFDQLVRTESHSKPGKDSAILWPIRTDKK